MSRLLRVTMRTDKERGTGFPFEVPVIAALEVLDLSAQVTFFVGENGSGKSTLLEAIAIAAELPPTGTLVVTEDPTLAAQHRLAANLRLAWAKKSKRGYFLRAEDYFGQQKARARVEARYWREKAEVAMNVPVRPKAEAMLADESAWAQYIARYDSRSHGESFLDFFRERVANEGLFLFDEPEAALSPMRQLALVALVVEASKDNAAQFVIATHSPILLSVPGARIYGFDGGRITQVAYDDLEHVRVTRDFLLNREAILRKLTEP